MNTQNKFLWGGVVIAIVIAITGLFTPGGQQVASNVSKVAQFGTIYDVFTGDYFNAYRGFQLNGVNIFGVDSTVFTLPSNVTSMTANGVTTYFLRQSMIAATTTPCALQTPAATTTIDVGSANFTVSSTTATTVTFAKATTAFATTTVLATSSISASAQATVLIATTTPVADTANGRTTFNDRTVGPSQWIVMSMTGGVGTFSPTGSCDVTVQSVN